MYKLKLFLFSILATLVVLCGVEKVHCDDKNSEQVMKGRTHFMFCSSCHGRSAEGRKHYGAPNLAGQHEWYILQQIKNFQESIREQDIENVEDMKHQRLILILPDQQAINNVALYVSSLQRSSPKATLKGNKQNGQKLYASCVTCHGDTGQGNQKHNAPMISQQHDWYLLRQMKNFKTGVRGKAEKDIYGKKCRPFHDKLSEEEMVDLAVYLNLLAK